MLEFLRKSAGSWMIKILLTLIVVAFVLMGAGSIRNRRSAAVASVNGEPITIQEYQEAYQNITANLRRQFGGNLNEEMLKMFNVKKQALDALIEKSLLLQVAEENNIRVPDESLIDSITRIPMFQRDGVFDPSIYQMVLSQNQLTPQKYEAMQKDAILNGKVKNFITNTVSVSEEEAKAWYAGQKTAINIDYTVFTPADFKDVKISDAETKTYFDAHKADYKTEPAIKARYVRFAPENYMSGVSATDEEIENYYTGHTSEFKTAESVSARHILLKLPEKAAAEKVEEQRKLALDIMDKAKAGKDFAELARQYSEDPGSKEKGGDLGSFTREKMVRPFSEKAFSMQPGQISDPVRTPFGWHIIKVENHTPESVKPLEAAKEGIRSKLAAQKAKNVAYDKALAAYDVSYDGNDLVRNTKDLGVEVKTTDFFTREEGPGVEDPGAFADAAFSLPLMEVSQVKDIGNSYYLIQVMEMREAKIPEFAAVKEKVLADAMKEKQDNAARDAANDFLKKAKAATLADAARQTGKPVKSTGFFTRNDPVPGIGQAPEISEAAFSRSSRKPLAESVLRHENGYYVIAFKENKVPDAATFEKEKTQTVSQLVMQKRQQMFDSWMKNLRENSKIIDNTDRVTE